MASYEKKYNLLGKFIGVDIYEYAQKHYPEGYADILKGKLSSELEAILKSCKHQMDKRTPLQYGQALLLGWVLEDHIFNQIKEQDSLAITKNGADAKREFLVNKKVSTDSDYLIKTTEKQFYIEVVADYTNHWLDYGKCDLRDDKLKKLIKHSKTADTYLLGIDVINNKYILTKISKDMLCKKIESHEAFGKPTYEIYLSKDNFKDISELNIKMLEA